jgi:hypothetical protein
MPDVDASAKKATQTPQDTFASKRDFIMMISG